MKKVKRIIEKQCPMCHDTCYMMVEAERYGTIMEYMVAMYYKTKRKTILEALPFLNKFGREFILTGYCPKCQAFHKPSDWRCPARYRYYK